MSEPSAAGIRLDGVVKRFGAHVAVDGVRLEVAPHERCVLIGPSGCGKSTLLRLVVGLLAPDAGSVQVGETPMRAETRRTLRLRMGYVIQEGGLFPHLTARANAAIVARDIGWTRDRVAARLDELAELVGLDRAMLDRFPGQLSGGQRQRVGLMRALVLDPDVLLMDEPLAALDPMIRARLQSDLRGLFERLRKTVLLVTHDMGEAAHLGDSIALMRDGRIVQRGRAADLLERPADPFVTEFLRAQRTLAGVEG